MKTFSLVLILALSGLLAQAQTVDVKGTDTNAMENDTTTTIEIKKGKKGEVKPSERQWEMTDGNADVEGEAAATSKDAKANWKKACAAWKKEIKEDNKENKVISLNCGAMNCSGDAGQKICTSQATFKIKTKVTN